jgi:hypothetical protein
MRQSVLGNGITVYSESDPRITNDVLRTAGVFVAAGSAFENHRTHGCAHFIRRFLYKVGHLPLHWWLVLTCSEGYYSLVVIEDHADSWRHYSPLGCGADAFLHVLYGPT